ncbi:hypothetical protein ASPCAL07977 [Aspergillus calidoustus]|uniref:Uncharacterized protein n=1 Tax=Aspergillus calidoustus TaxID=454130 RepID=A0A0U4ZZD0_ASPCI|nr:hypothetical protein ASPCAL07977 [Aspergillus calidoustus]
MGWFWGGSNDNDPVKKIDPGLREYLEHEAPQKYVPAQSPPTVEKPTQSSKTVPADQSGSSTPAVPSKSLYPDGRYADLWKTYKPPVDDALVIGGKEHNLSAAQGVQQMNDRRKQRRDTIGRVAAENCAVERENAYRCFEKGTFWERMKTRSMMGQEENKIYNRCYATQAKFLQALGYAASPDWDEEREERIQMHADKLYHQMLEYENRVKEAEAAGLEPPPLTSLFNPGAETVKHTEKGSTTVEIPGGQAVPAGFHPVKPWEQLTPHERELELKSHYAELESERVYVEATAPYVKAQDEARAKRREKAVSWFGETVGKWIT